MSHAAVRVRDRVCRRSSAHRAGDDGGFALVAVLLVLAFVSVLAVEFSYIVRLEVRAVQNWKDNIVGSHLADAAVTLATGEILVDYGYVGLGDDGEVAFFNREAQLFPRPTRKNIQLGPGVVSYRIYDEQGRLSLNFARRDRLERLLQELGLEKRESDVILDSIEDWRDADEKPRPNGAESEDYLKLAVPYRSRNANFLSTTELLQVKGVTSALFNGTHEHPPLAALITARASGPQVNLNTAPPIVLRAIGLSSAEVQEIEQTRAQGIYRNTSRFGGQGFTVRSQVFRIEAEGVVDGRPVARLTVIVQKGGSARDPSLTILDWLS